jgi:hypothetical protein
MLHTVSENEHEDRKMRVIVVEKVSGSNVWDSFPHKNDCNQVVLSVLKIRQLYAKMRC